MSKAILSGRTALLIRGTSVFSKDSLVGFIQGLLGECSQGFCVSYDVLQADGGTKMAAEGRFQWETERALWLFRNLTWLCKPHTLAGEERC